MTLARLILSRSLLSCALAFASANGTAQQPDDTTPPPQTQAPAPVVRRTPKPATSPANSITPTTPGAPPAAKPAAKAIAKKPPAAASAATSAPQPSPAGPFNRTVILLDPAHGGGDTGSRISDSVTEKDITLALAFRLRSLLNARGFTTVMTRETDDIATAPNGTPSAPLTLDDRAGIANHARPLACLLLHATASGSGVHLYTSELASVPAELSPAPWLTAQAAWVAQSQHLATQIGAALGRAKIPLVNSRASVRPVDSLTCPALVVELAPNNGDIATLTDGGYQQRVAEAIVGAMVFWQNQAQPPPRLLPVLPPPPPAAPIAPSTTPATTEVQP